MGPPDDIQDRVFRTSEADSWFARNRSALRADAEHDPILRLVELYQLAPRQVLEVGAANGYRVAPMVERGGCSGAALELSFDAVADGRRRYPAVRFVQGRAQALPFTTASFNLVVVNFVLHWLDRANLLPTVAELDRVLAPDGHVVIGDFYPPKPTKVRYHHVTDAEVYTYKQDYSLPFLASGSYRMVAMLTGRHGGRTFAADAAPEDLIATWLLRKETGGLLAPGVRGGSS